MKPPKAEAQEHAATSRAQDVAARALFDQFFTPPEGEQELPGVLLLVNIERVRPRESQPRSRFDEEKLNELAQDVADLRARGGGVGGTGILQPLTVAALDLDAAPTEDSEGAFSIVAGERRYRAAVKAGCSQVPVIVREARQGEGDDSLWEDALRENIQRENLTPLEEALALQRLMQGGGHSIRGLAQRLGKGKGYIEQRLALAKAGQDVQEMVSRRQDTISIAREIDKVQEPAPRARLIEMALAGAPVTKLREEMEKAQQNGQKPQGRSEHQAERASQGAGATGPITPGRSRRNLIQETTDPQHTDEAEKDSTLRFTAQVLELIASNGDSRWIGTFKAAVALVDAVDATDVQALSEAQRQEAHKQMRGLEERLALLKTALSAPSDKAIDVFPAAP